MATVTGLTAERMIEMENATVVDGYVSGADLILVTRDGSTINAGVVTGPMGPSGGSFIVCTSTTRPTLTAGEAGKAIYETDTKLIRIWIGTRWRVQEKIICTSSTRPAMASADEGVKIYETDTDSEYTWTGTSWLQASSTIAKFSSASARASAWPSPPVGSISYLTDSPGIFWIYEAGVWNTVGPPPGSHYPYIGDVAPFAHVFMYGQTIGSAQTLYPVLWANIPAIWKSGSSLIVPDYRGRVSAGKDNMGGTTAGLLGSGSSMPGTTLGGKGGSQHTQTHKHSVVDPQHNHGEVVFGAGSAVEDASGFGSLGGNVGLTGNRATGISLQDYGSGSYQNVQPTIIMNWILKII